MTLTQRSPAVFLHDGARKCDLARQLINSENSPSRGDPQVICSSDRLASSIASVVAPPDFALRARHGDARDDAGDAASPAFDYGTLDAETAASIRMMAETIRKRMKNSIVETGRDLIRAKAQLAHGAFGPWLDAEFGMSSRTAQNYMRATDLADSKSEIVSHLPATILFRLAAPSTPEAVRDDAIARLERGEPVTGRGVNMMISAARFDAALLRKQKKATDKRRWKRLSKETEPARQKLEAERRHVEETAAREAVALLQRRLGDEFATFVDLYNRGAFRFGGALRSAWLASSTFLSGRSS